MTRVVIRAEAEVDLDAIFLFVAEQSIERAATLSRRLRARCQILATHPMAGRPATTSARECADFSSDLTC